MPLTIVFCVDSLEAGGTELNAVRTAERLDRRRFRVQVVALGADGPLRTRYEQAGIAVHRHPIGGLAGDGERLDEQVVERGAVREPVTELDGLALQLVVGQPAQLVAERVDVGNDRLQGFDLLAFSRAEDAIENAHAGHKPIGGQGS